MRQAYFGDPLDGFPIFVSSLNDVCLSINFTHVSKYGFDSGALFGSVLSSSTFDVNLCVCVRTQTAAYVAEYARHGLNTFVLGSFTYIHACIHAYMTAHVTKHTPLLR